MAFEDRWDKWYSNNLTKTLTYDDWLDKYSNIINKVNTKILDLGCGSGNDTFYLIERNHQVLACDYSLVALEQINKNIPQAETMLIDISKPLPFRDNCFDLIIADLSLHYFDDQATTKIMYEIKRILAKNGFLLARVNSVNDINHGANQGKKSKIIITILMDAIKDFSPLMMLKNTFLSLEM